MLLTRTSLGVKAPDIETSYWLNVKDDEFGSLAGKVVVVNFWTYACHHCQSLLRHLSVLRRNFRKDPFELISVHTPEFLFEADVDNVARAVREYRIGWPVAIDNDYENFNKFDVRFWPTTVLINSNGKIVGRFIGAGSFPDLAREIDKLLPGARGSSRVWQGKSDLLRDNQAGGERLTTKSAQGVEPGRHSDLINKK